MNRTVTINISGIIFHIEEDAYESLSKYLITIKGYFSNTDGGNEIMSDIEARIAELLQQKINTSKQVVLMSDVDHVKGIMGKPEEFGGEQAKEETKTQQDHTNVAEEKVKRRLFRNPDEKAIGGVCSGLAAYFDVDIVWIRLAMFLLIFFGGISLWVYIILWIIIPEAKTTADKFAMRGESANINNIVQSFKDEAHDVKNRFKNNAYSNSVQSNVSRILNGFFNIVGRLIGLFLVFLGCVFLFAYVTSLFGISVADSNTDVTNWKAVIFNTSSDYALAVLAFIIVIGIPVFMLLYSGIKLLFKISYSNRWLNLSLGIVWLVGLIIGFYVTVSTVKQFNQTSKVRETVELRGLGDTLIVKLNPAMETLKPFSFENADDLETYFGKNHSGYQFGELHKKLSIIGYADLDIVESNSDSIVELIINYSSRGLTKEEANENAKTIKYSYKQNGNELIFDEVFSVIADAKFKGQEVEMKLKLPRGKVIYLDKSVKYLLNDIENTTNTWDGHMVGRRWQMTDRGLKCIDCEGLEDEFDDDHHHVTKTVVIEDGEVIINETRGEKKDVVIDKNGLKINGKDAEIKIDEHGIKIKTPKEPKEPKAPKEEN